MWTPAGGWAPWTCLPSTTAFLSPSPFPSLCSHHLNPSHSFHWWGSCCWVAFSEIATAFLVANMVWCLCILVLLALAKTLGYSQCPTLCCTRFALATTLLPSSKSTYIRFGPHVSPTILPGEHISGSSLLPQFMKWYSKNVHILNMLNRMKALCFNPQISNSAEWTTCIVIIKEQINKVKFCVLPPATGCWFYKSKCS